jgi:tripartite-type tricarboxylate transporter receptor subunit TctC
MLKSLVSILGIAFAYTVLAQAYPSKPIRLVLPTIPGSAFEVSGRVITSKMAERLGQPIVAENRSGANGLIGAEIVAKSLPDGYTLLWATASSIVTSRFVIKNLPFDPDHDFTPISIGASPATVIVLNNSVPASNVKEFIDYARRNPGKLSYGSPGIGSLFHLIGEAFAQEAGLQMVHVPYKGPPQALNDLFGGRIEMTIVTLGTASPLQKSGKLKILALLEAQRYPGAPELATVGETLAGFEKPPGWFALFGPGGLPQPIVQRLYRELAGALKTPEVRTWLDTNLHDAGGNTPEEFSVQYKKSFDIFAKAIRAAGVKPE